MTSFVSSVNKGVDKTNFIGMGGKAVDKVINNPVKVSLRETDTKRLQGSFLIIDINIKNSQHLINFLYMENFISGCYELKKSKNNKANCLLLIKILRIRMIYIKVPNRKIGLLNKLSSIKKLQAKDSIIFNGATNNSKFC